MVINLKKTKNLGKILADYVSDDKKKNQIKNEIQYYEEYYLTNSGLVKAFHQEFNRDPYMGLEPIPNLRLVSYSPNIDFEELKQILDKYNLPIITRANEMNLEMFKNIEFKEIPNFEGNPTILLPMRFKIPKNLKSIDPKIRPMKKEDLKIISEILKNEYSLRYKMTKMMYEDHPEACFVYEEDGLIKGVTFNKIENGELCGELYLRQMFVNEKHRGKRIGSSLYNARLKFAKEKGIEYAHGSMRKEAQPFHKKFNIKVYEELREFYIIKG